MQVRLARHTGRLEEVVGFYRDGLGLPELGSFRDHDGYDGVFLGLPGTNAHLEFTSGGDHDAPGPHPESLLVLYLGDAEAGGGRGGRQSCRFGTGRAREPLLEATCGDARRPGWVPRGARPAALAADRVRPPTGA